MTGVIYYNDNTLWFHNKKILYESIIIIYSMCLQLLNENKITAVKIILLHNI